MWQKRPLVTLKCPSGVECQVRRPGPELALRAGRLPRPLQALNPKLTEEEAQLALNALSEDEMAALMSFARDLVCGCVVSPKLCKEADPNDQDAVHVDDLPPGDFWQIYYWGLGGGASGSVAVADGEVDVEDVRTFPSEQRAGIGPDNDVSEVQPETIGSSRDRRSADSD